jgi:hypothetical protein
LNFSEITLEILREHAIGPERPTPASLARYLAPEADRYLDRVRFDPARCVRHPVLLWEDWEVMVIGWETGQITPVHDHRGVLGGMSILSGTILEERLRFPRICRCSRGPSTPTPPPSGTEIVASKIAGGFPAQEELS